MRKVTQALNTFLIMLFLFPVVALAGVDSGFSVGAKTEWVDNIEKSSFERDSGVINTLLLKANLSDQESSYSYGIKYEADYRDYSGGEYDTNLYLTGNTYLNLELIPDRLAWNNKLRSAITERDSRLPSVPSNQDQRNTITTSPVLTLVNTKRDRVVLKGTLEKNVYRERSQNDSDRYKAYLDYSHAISKLALVGVACGFASADFDTDTGYDSLSCKLVSRKRIKQGVIAFEVGQRQVEPDRGDDFEGAEYSLTANLELGLDRLYVYSSREVTDTVDGFYGSDFTRNSRTLQDTNTDLLSLTVRKRSEIGYERSFSSVSKASVFAFVAIDDLHRSDFDTEREGVGFNYFRTISATTSFEFYSLFQKTEFGGGAVPLFLSYSTDYLAALNRDLSEAFRLRGWLRAEDRRSKTETATYEAYIVGLSALYSF